MPFYFRKSISAGPFRFNFSSGGVGMSVGVKGLRIGTGPRGHYVQAGRGGFYYRASLGQSGRRSNVPAPTMNSQPPSRYRSEGAVEMIEVTSGNVLAMEDAAFGDVLTELNTKHGQVRLAVLLAAASAAIALMLLAVLGSTMIAILLLVPIGFAVGAWLDSYHRAAVLFYGVDQHTETRFTKVCNAFDSLAGCAGKWHIEAGGTVRDITTWKREAGASHLVKRSSTTLSYALPAVLRCNITPPALKVGRRTIYFLPDVALIHDASGFGAVSYDGLHLAWQPSNFIETDGVPSDAEIIRHTWQHPNKNGGPDRRFKQNRRLPVCRYEALHLSSDSGINELVEFSRVGFVQPLALALKSLPKNTILAPAKSLTYAR